jgi:hypothetical protein
LYEWGDDIQEEMTDQSLREEIISEILRGNKIKTPEDVVDEIFTKIEKRIDTIPLSEYVEGHYQGISLNQIQRDTIEKVKEILK